MEAKEIEHESDGRDMMSILDRVSKTESGAPRITIYGRPGIGKSTLASSFPEPLFVLTEDPELIGIDALPIAKTFEDVWSCVKDLLKEAEEGNLPYKTIVLDSLSKLDELVIRRILDSEPPTRGGQKITTLAAACGGYGAGYARAQGVHRAFKAMMDQFKGLGIAVVYVSHLAVVKHKSPDNEDYDIFSIVMNHEKSRECYIDDVDAVLYCKLKAYTTETESGRTIIKSTSDHVIIPGVNEGNVSKNRFNMPAEIPMTFDAIKQYIPFYKELNDNAG